MDLETPIQSPENIQTVDTGELAGNIDPGSVTTVTYLKCDLCEVSCTDCSYKDSDDD